MSTVNVSVTTKKQLVPSAQAAAMVATVRYQLMQNDVVKAAVSGPLTGIGTFSGVVDGTYIVTASRVTNTGVVVGDVATSEPFVVLATTEVDVPDVINVAVA